MTSVSEVKVVETLAWMHVILHWSRPGDDHMYWRGGFEVSNIIMEARPGGICWIYAVLVTIRRMGKDQVLERAEICSEEESQSLERCTLID